MNNAELAARVASAEEAFKGYRHLAKSFAMLEDEPNIQKMIDNALAAAQTLVDAEVLLIKNALDKMKREGK